MVRLSKIVTVEVLDKEGGTNVADALEVEKLTDILSNLPSRILRNYWILVLKQGRIIESNGEFVERVKKEIKKWNAQMEKEKQEAEEEKKKQERRHQYVG